MGWTQIETIAQPFNYEDFLNLYDNARYLAKEKNIATNSYLRIRKTISTDKYKTLLVDVASAWADFISIMVDLVPVYGITGFDGYIMVSSLQSIFRNQNREYNRIEMETAIKYLNYCKSILDEQE